MLGKRCRFERNDKTVTSEICSRCPSVVIQRNGGRGSTCLAGPSLVKARKSKILLRSGLQLELVQHVGNLIWNASAVQRWVPTHIIELELLKAREAVVKGIPINRVQIPADDSCLSSIAVGSEAKSLKNLCSIVIDVAIRRTHTSGYFAENSLEGLIETSHFISRIVVVDAD